MERWFQNTRGLVIVALAVVTCVVLLAIDPGDGFPSGVGGGSADGASAPVTTTVTTSPLPTTSTIARPTLQQGSTGADVTVLQTKLAQLGYNVGTPDGSFGPGTKAAVIAFQTKKGITPADGVVNQATWSALLANQ